MNNNILEEFTINKTQCELYKIRHQTGMYWADITLDYNDNHGRVQIASDYGSWQNYWGSCGCSFKEFLIRIDIGYFANKVGEDRWFDERATKNKMHSDIKQARKDKAITAEEASVLCKEGEDIFSDITCEEDYKRLVYDSKPMWEFYQDPSSFPLATNISPQFKRFFNEPWQVFINQLKQELSTK